MARRFEKGDRVVLVTRGPTCQVPPGSFATVVSKAHGVLGVRFDERCPEGHSLNGLVDWGHGHSFATYKFQRIQEDENDTLEAW